MEWERVSNDEIEQAFVHFFGLSSVTLAEICDLIIAADRGQQFLTDGSPNTVHWLSAWYGIRHSTSRRPVDTTRRLETTSSLVSEAQ